MRVTYFRVWGYHKMGCKYKWQTARFVDTWNHWIRGCEKEYGGGRGPVEAGRRDRNVSKRNCYRELLMEKLLFHQQNMALGIYSDRACRTSIAWEESVWVHMWVVSMYVRIHMSIMDVPPPLLHRQYFIWVCTKFSIYMLDTVKLELTWCKYISTIKYIRSRKHPTRCDPPQLAE